MFVEIRQRLGYTIMRAVFARTDFSFFGIIHIKPIIQTVDIPLLSLLLLHADAISTCAVESVARGGILTKVAARLWLSVVGAIPTTANLSFGCGV
jgi:hypothetical protein